MTIPNIVYKYRGFNQYLLMELINQSVWFSTPSKLNDPFDCQLVLEGEAPTKDAFETRKKIAFQRYANRVGKTMLTATFASDCYIGRELTDEYKNEIYQFKGHVEENLRAVGVFSVSEEHANTTMWSHYGASHTGICIGYFTDKLFPKNNLKDLIHRVNYKKSDEIRCNAYELFADCCCNQDSETYFNIVNTLMSTKSIDWSYEKEWRFINEREGGIHIGQDSIHSIYFGMRTKPEEKSTIRNILANTPMLFFQMIPRKNGLGLESINMNKSSRYWEQCPEDI
jgi:hypothetical protein